MKNTKRAAKQRLALAVAVLAPTLFLGGRKVDELSADPLVEKDCPPTNTEPASSNNGANAITQNNTVAEPNWKQKNGTLNDASCLNRTPVFGVVQVRTYDDVKQAFAYARASGLKVSIAGVRHSMGGHAFAKNAIVLDMTQFNAINVDAVNKTMTVQAGATWHDIQKILHPKFAVKAMQSTDIFTVGGSISVNAHGMDHQVGAIASTIRAMRVMQPDGMVKTVSRESDPEWFNLIVGGYGLFGVVLDVDLDIVDNVVYATGRRLIDYNDFPQVFATEIAPNKQMGLFYSHLSTSPDTLLREMIFYTYVQQDVPDAQIPELGEVGGTKLRRFTINFSKLGGVPMRLKWLAEKYIEPKMEACTVTRNQAQASGEACLVSRNEPMHDSVKYLKNPLPNETDILQEYFVPRANFLAFVDGLRTIVQQDEVNVLNASVRIVHQENVFLSYAPQDSFSVVLYINQKTDEAGNQKMRSVTSKLIDLTTKQGGRFFLPYQLHYTPQQLQQAYPQINEFFALKRKFDPQELLTNTFYEKYGKVS